MIRRFSGWMRSSSMNRPSDQNTLAPFDEHFEASVTAGLCQFFNQDALLSLLGQAVLVISASEPTHWIDCPNTMHVHQDFKIPFAKTTILYNVTRESPNSNMKACLDAVELLFTALMAYEMGYTYTQVLNGGQARQCIVDIHHREKNLQICYLLSIIYSHPLRYTLVKTINVALKDPRTSYYAGDLIPKDYPQESRSKMLLYQLLSYALGLTNGKEYQERITSECQTMAVKVVHGNRLHTCSRRCFTVTRSTK